jgi:hypothetical protein
MSYGRRFAKEIPDPAILAQETRRSLTCGVTRNDEFKGSPFRRPERRYVTRLVVDGEILVATLDRPDFERAKTVGFAAQCLAGLLLEFWAEGPRAPASPKAVAQLVTRSWKDALPKPR